jgi:hypothetical protein
VRYRFGHGVVARVWEWMRRTFTIDWRRIRRKKDIKKEITTRKKFLLQVIRWNRTMRGVSPEEAKKELNRIEKEENKLHKNPVFKRGWYQIKPLTKKTMYVRSHRRKGIQVRSYNREYLRWTSAQKRWLLERERMPPKQLQKSFFKHFGIYRSIPSLITMRSRLRRR